MSYHKLFIFFSLCCFSLKIQAFALVPEDDSTKKNEWTFALGYANHNQYKGRIDSTHRGYLSPSLTYEHHSGIFGTLSGYHLIAQPQFIDEVNIGFGYDFKIGKKFDATLQYDHFFFSTSSKQLRSVVNNMLTLRMGYDFNLIYSELYTCYSPGKSGDIAFYLENSHEFEWDSVAKGPGDLFFCPAISFVAGTQNFYSGYLMKRGMDKKGSMKNKMTTVVTSTSFSFLYTEFALPLYYDWGRFSFGPGLKYIFPIQEKSLKSFFLFDFSVSMTL